MLPSNSATTLECVISGLGAISQHLVSLSPYRPISTHIDSVTEATTCAHQRRDRDEAR
jgi:hypothetical protein